MGYRDMPLAKCTDGRMRGWSVAKQGIVLSRLASCVAARQQGSLRVRWTREEAFGGTPRDGGALSDGKPRRARRDRREAEA